uniref:FTH domain-containing protein n=1 Tax=Caenorhabditis tropicalis TaxID=1561998 RepID=A0A1I7V0E3_9PELO
MIKRGTLTYASSMLKKGLNEAIGVVDCKLRKMRMIKTGKRLVHTICEIGMNNLSKWNEKEVSEIMEKIENLIEKLKFQWKEYRYGNGETSETFEVIKCECTILWEKEDPKLKKSLKEISEFSSFDLISGCPLNYKHSIKLKFSGKVK